MSFIYGPPVTGANFINRKKELFRLIDEIKLRTNEDCDNPHIEISAPRRIGKSSLLLKLKDELKREEFTPIYIQLLDIGTIDDFFNRLRNEVISHLPLAKGVMEALTSGLQKAKADISKIKPTISVDSEGTFELSYEEISSLYQGTWRENGEKLFDLLRKYKKLKIVLFLDEMGFVRKLNESDEDILEFLNFLDRQLGNKETPTCVLCGSQNFFLILRNIKPEIYQLWRRKFMKFPINVFNREDTIEKLVLPKLNSEEKLNNDFFTNDIKEGLAEFIYFVSNGYPSVAQILGREIVSELKYFFSMNTSITIIDFEKIVFDAFNKIIRRDSQAICKELLSEEALGENYLIYKRLITELYFNPSKDIESIPFEGSQHELDQLLRDLEDQQYITVSGNNYIIMYPFLKYYIWHPRKDEETIREVEDKWRGIIQN